ncbi:MAG TPA: cell wall hydrolase [Clostridia bacterium]|nr:cell wall hydrolase [Clostridia bacterium]
MSRFKRLAFLFTLLIVSITIIYSGFTGMAEAAGDGYYTVEHGDTLYSIANSNDTNINNLTAVNNIVNNIIWPGQVLVIPQQGKQTSIISDADLRLLARLIYAEARGETLEGKVAVGAVVLNRVRSPYFPDTVEEVIFQKNTYVYQFSPVGDGTINLEPDEPAIEAASIALSGLDPTEGALYFYNPEIADDVWIRTLPVIKRIGNHIFAQQ